MKQDVLKNIQSYCKNRKTRGRLITALHKDFIAYPTYPAIPLHEFEQGLQSLEKKVIKDLEIQCLEFMTIHGSSLESRASFVKQKEFVTTNFWERLAKKSGLEIVVGPKPVDPEPQTTVPPVEPKALPENKTQPAEQPQDYKTRLPLDWNKMILPERIDFAKKIQHKGFLTYVLSLDESLAEYLKKLKTKEKKQGINLYVSLFSIPSKSTSEESKALLKSFVDSLNMLGRARLEYVELVDPPVIEIREVRR